MNMFRFMVMHPKSTFLQIVCALPNNHYPCMFNTVSVISLEAFALLDYGVDIPVWKA